MPQSVATWSRMRCALLGAALIVAPTQLSAQSRSSESVVITAASVRVRTAPSISSLSIDDFARGSIFPLAGEDYQTADWIAVVVDGRIAYVPRVAAALRQRATASAADPAEGGHTVVQAGLPASAPAPAPAMVAPRAKVAERASAPATAPAPAAVEDRPAQPAPAPAQVARSAPAPAPAERAADRAITAAPAAAPAPAAVVAAAPMIEPAQPAAPSQGAAVETKTETPLFKARRPALNFTAGVLGSATVIETFGLPRAVHVTGASFVGVRFHMLGLYVAPEMGQGGGFRSTSLDGGASLDLIRLHMLRVSALGGYLRHSETTVPEDSTVVPVTRSLDGYTVGGMASIPFIGPLRLAYRGQYDTVRDAGIPIHRVKHSVGIVY